MMFDSMNISLGLTVIIYISSHILCAFMTTLLCCGSHQPECFYLVQGTPYISVMHSNIDQARY